MNDNDIGIDICPNCDNYTFEDGFCDDCGYPYFEKEWED